MASKDIPPHAQAVINKCEICDTGNDARWYCKDCDEEMCKQCKIIHLRSKQSRNHDVISIVADIETPQEGQGHKNTPFCSSHPKEPVQMYCINCEDPVCVTCIADKKHKTHSFDKLTDVLDQYKEKLSSSMDTVKQQIAEFKTSLLSVQDNEVTYSSQSDDTIDEINKRRQELKSQIDMAADTLVYEVKEHQRNDLKDIRKQSKELQKLVSDREKMLKTCEEKLRCENDISIIKFNADVKTQLEMQIRSLQLTFISPPKFDFNDSVDLAEVFGHLEAGRKEKKMVTTVPVNKPNEDPVEKKTSKSAGFTMQRSPTIDTTTVTNIDPGMVCHCVSTVSERQAWLGNLYSTGREVALIDIDGHVLKKIKLDFKMNDIAVTSTGELLLTTEHQIKKYMQNGEFVKIIDMSRCSLEGLTIASNNDLLVCCCSDNGPKVTRLSITGQTKQIIQKDKQDKLLLNNPRLITENINNDICVVNGYYDVVVVNKYGDFRFRYPDTATSENSISNCYGIVCDKVGHILISDLHKHRVHQIDRDGRFVQYVLTQQHGINYPWGLSIDRKGQLWICNQGGQKCIVIKYQSK